MRLTVRLSRQAKALADILDSTVSTITLLVTLNGTLSFTEFLFVLEKVAGDSSRMKYLPRAIFRPIVLSTVSY